MRLGFHHSTDVTVFSNHFDYPPVFQLRTLHKISHLHFFFVPTFDNEIGVLENYTKYL